MRLGFILIWLLVNVKRTYTLDCLSCTSTNTNASCSTTVTCNAQQSCFKDVSAHVTVHGCIDNTKCDLSAGSNIIGRSVEDVPANCHECCSTDRCNENLCSHPALDGNWVAWSAWSSCDVTCGNGVISRSRTCTNPAPRDGGYDCIGKSSETMACRSGICPVNGGWSGWGIWESCSVTCGVGIQKRHRSCSNPFPSALGLHCFGEAIDVQICQPGSCAASASGQAIAFQSKDSVNETVTSNQTIIFGKTSLNEGSGYDNTTGIFTAPKDGTYLFTTQMCVYGNNYLHWAILANDVALKKGYFGDGSYNKCYTADAVALLKAGDHVSIQCTSGSAKLLQDGDKWNTFTGVLLN